MAGEIAREIAGPQGIAARKGQPGKKLFVISKNFFGTGVASGTRLPRGFGGGGYELGPDHGCPCGLLQCPRQMGLIRDRLRHARCRRFLARSRQRESTTHTPLSAGAILETWQRWSTSPLAPESGA